MVSAPPRPAGNDTRNHHEVRTSRKGSMRKLLSISAVALIGVVLSACSKAADEAPAPVASGAAPSSQPPVAKPAPTMRDVAATPDDKVGVLAPNTGIPVGEKIPDMHA